MRTGENNVNLTQLEKREGQKAARVLRRDLRAVLSVLNISESSTLLKKTSVQTKMQFDALDHLAIVTPHYVFKQHYGFEGIKKNGVKMSMKPFNHFITLFDKTKALDQLADAISKIRLEEITSKIRF